MRFAVLSLLLLLSGGACAANYPCSGSKGGINHCRGHIFVCNDGTASQSKKDCRIYLGQPGGDDDKPSPAPQGLMGAPPPAGPISPRRY